MVPVMIPVRTHSSPSFCPECGKEERKITVCGHCGYKYKVGGSGWAIVVGLFIVLFIILSFCFFGVTFM